MKYENNDALQSPKSIFSFNRMSHNIQVKTDKESLTI